MSKSDVVKALAEAFVEDAPCTITYRDSEGRWTERTVWITELHQDHILTQCELRDGGHRRFNLRGIYRVGRPAPPSALAA
jgi:hypothetical protein